MLRISTGLLVQSAIAAARLFGSSFGAPAFDIFNPHKNATFDYIVVGAGTAGIPIAVRLAEDGYTVALVEAGSYAQLGNGNFSQVPLYASAFQHTYEGSLINPMVDWNITTTPQGNLTRLYPQGKALGGTSTRSHQAFMFSNKGSYQAWADAVGDASYTYDNFSRFLHKPLNFTPPASSRSANSTARYSSDLLNLTQGPLQVTFSAFSWPWSSWVQKALTTVGVAERKDGFTGGNLLGSGYLLSSMDATTFTKDSSETSYLRKLGLENENLIIYTNTLATRVLFDSDKTAIGVTIDFGGLPRFLISRKEVILSAGAFRSPQLLMLSGIGPKATLGEHGIEVIADLPGVGQNLGDHSVTAIARKVNVMTTAELQRNPEFARQSLEQYRATPPRGPLTSYAGDMAAFEKLPLKYRQKLSPDIRKSLDQYSQDWPELEYITFSAYGGPNVGYLGSPDGQNWATTAVALVAPFSRGNVTIRSADARENPVVNPAWLSDPRDQQMVVQAFRRLQEILNQTSIAPALLGDDAFPPPAMVDGDERILAFVQLANNPLFQASCTARMGRKDDPMAVIDPKARVYNVKNLRVVDASSFPILLPSHIQGTIYGLAEKIAEDIIQHEGETGSSSRIGDSVTHGKDSSPQRPLSLAQ
ncbi:GMC oxidoreductase [Trichoderma aethiopicum]